MRNIFVKISLALLLSFACEARSSHSSDLSNQLPVNIVDALIAKGLWSTDYENGGSDESSAILNFYQGLKNPQINPKNIANELFNDSNNSNGFTKKSRMYDIKVTIYRESLASLNTERARFIENSIVEKYFDYTAALIEQANIKEMAPILERAKYWIHSNAIHLADLNSRLVSELAKEKTAHHIDPKNIHGVYIPSKRILAIDISKSVSENIITLSHELVHMADPEQDNNLAEMKAIYPQLIARLMQDLGDESEAKKQAEAILKDVYLEIGDESLLSVVDFIQQKRADVLKAIISESKDKDLATDPIIKKWTDLAINTTIENELRAYLFSLAIYQSLSIDLKILPESQERDRNVLKICDENFSFARSLSAAMNPFNSSTYLGLAVGSNFKPSFFLVDKVNLVKSALELHYMTELQSAINQYPTKYASLISFLKEHVKAQVENNLTEAKSNDDILPKWAQPGQLETSVNPYTILTAKLSTAWVLRFKQSAATLAQDIRNIGEPILLMKAGILDLHDITFGELKLLGIQSKNSDSTELPHLLDSNLRVDLSIEDLAFSKYLGLSDWRPTDFSSRGVIAQPDLQSSLYRLRLLKLLSWLELKFPIAAENVSSVKILKNQILDGVYDHDELSKDRIQELNTELDNVTKVAAFTNTDLTQINYLMKVVGGLYTLTKTSDWSSISLRYEKRIRSAMRLLERNGYIANFNSVDFEKNYAEQLLTFKKSIQEEYSFCRDSDEMQFVPSPKKFEFMGFIFPLTTICHNKNIYIFRRPGDLNESATTFIVNGRPESRIFFGSRPVRLDPFIGGKK